MTDPNAKEPEEPATAERAAEERGARQLPASVAEAELARPAARFEEDLEEAARYFEASLAEATRRAYASAWARFSAYCASRGRPALPAAPETIAGYLSAAAPGYAASTLRQHLAAIRHVHRRRFPGAVSPTKSALVENVLAGIVRGGSNQGGNNRRDSSDADRPTGKSSQKRPGRRPTGKRPVDRAEPLRTRHLKKILQVLPGSAPAPSRSGNPTQYAAWLRGLRDRALLLVGFAGALRRSELSALGVEDISFRLEGCLLYIGRSKTDQEGAGEEVAIAYGEHAATCPVEALRRWLSAADLHTGSLFRGVRRSGHLRSGPLTGRSVSRIVKKAAEAAGLTASRLPGSRQRRRFSGHSLRAGHITEATSRGAPDHLVMQQSRHRDRKTFDSYVRPERLLSTSSSRHLGL